MGESSALGLSLFDLLARDWTLESEVVQTAFNHDDTAVVYRLASGNLALATTRDAESPKIRTHIELETGRPIIRPRENAVPPLTTPATTVRADLPVVRFGVQDFAAIDQDGALRHVAAGGLVLTRSQPGNSTVTSLCSTTTGNVIALARQARIALYETNDMHVLAEVELDHPVACQSISPDGSTLAAWGGNTLSLIDLHSPSTAPRAIECGGDIGEISWQEPSGRLSCASTDNCFYIVDCSAGVAHRVGGFPSPVRNSAFSDAGNALVASGAFRLVGWDSTDLPENDHPGTPLTSGKAGLVVINVIATHPERNLVATGYANGLVAIVSIGSAEEMMLHQERETEVSSLSWSQTGEHLAIGYASGKAAIVTFPAQMFK